MHTSCEVKHRWNVWLFKEGTHALFHNATGNQQLLWLQSDPGTSSWEKMRPFGDWPPGGGRARASGMSLVF